MLLLSLSLNPLWGQQEVVQPIDSIENVELVFPEADSVDVSLADTIAPSADTLATTADEEHVHTESCMVLLASWSRCNPFAEPLSDAIKAAEADSLNPSALRLLVDSLPLDPSLKYAQRDLRLPLILDGQVPVQSRKSISQRAQKIASRQNPLVGSFTNPYQKQLEYGAISNNAVYQHALRNLRSVSRIRSNRSDFPTERKLIERQEFSGDEQIDAGLGLELEIASLNVEQVTFHADKWHRRGTTDLQVSQTALSDNWYKGGDNNMTLSTYDKLVFSRFDESKKTTLDITLELRLSGYYTKADTIHPMRVNDNQFRVDVSYGYKAWKNWYYSSTAYVKTPVFEYYNANSKTVKSNFFAPLEMNLAVGMDLKLTQHKNWSYSLMLAPLSYNLKYVADERVNVTSYGIKANRRQLNQVGASITSKLEWKINESVAWSSRAYFFTSYHAVTLEFENTFNVKLGRYSTAKIYLYPRFDDSVDDKIQMKEMLTFGLAFAW